MTVEIHRTTAIAAPIELVYRLSLSIDIHLESFAPFGEKAVGKLTTGVMDLGDEVTWKARHLGIPFRLTTKITEATAPTWFVDEQVGGPFRHFRHEHRFLEIDGKTSMIDHMSFRAPLGPSALSPKLWSSGVTSPACSTLAIATSRKWPSGKPAEARSILRQRLGKDLRWPHTP